MKMLIMMVMAKRNVMRRMLMILLPMHLFDPEKEFNKNLLFFWTH